MAHGHLQETPERHLKLGGNAQPLQVPAKGLFAVQLGQPAVAGEAQIFRLAEQAPKQPGVGQHRPGREEAERAGRREVAEKVAGRQTRRGGRPPSVPEPAQLHLGSDQGKPQLSAQPEGGVVGGAEEVGARIHGKAVDAIADQAPADMVLGLQEQGIDTRFFSVYAAPSPAAPPPTMTTRFVLTACLRRVLGGHPDARVW